MSHYRQTLMALRCDVNLIRDNPFAAREAVMRIMKRIDIELERLETEPEIMACQPGVIDLTQIPKAILLDEICRRIPPLWVKTAVKICVECKKNPVRAKGLCKVCYKRAYSGKLKINQVNQVGKDGIRR